MTLIFKILFKVDLKLLSLARLFMAKEHNLVNIKINESFILIGIWIIKDENKLFSDEHCSLLNLILRNSQEILIVYMRKLAGLNWQGRKLHSIHF